MSCVSFFYVTLCDINSVLGLSGVAQSCGAIVLVDVLI